MCRPNFVARIRRRMLVGSSASSMVLVMERLSNLSLFQQDHSGLMLELHTLTS